MLRTRVITALVLLAIILAIIWLNSFAVFAAAVTVFFSVAVWESLRLFKWRSPVMGAAIWTGLFIALMLFGSSFIVYLIFVSSVAIWSVRLAPSLGIGLPPLESFGNLLLSITYSLAVLASFAAIIALYQRSAFYLVSIMGLVWVADIGAYFAGKAFGKHKLAPSISPGKTWEGALGGWLAVLVIAVIMAIHPYFEQSYVASIRTGWGWIGLILIMTLLVAGSIIGDLFESQLKRRAGMKDSSNLLPGHGGVLDRVDALVPTLPLAVLTVYWL